jgi:PKD repeat protein
MGTRVRFFDRTTFDDRGDDRFWTWTTDHDPATFSSRSPSIDFGEYGIYEVTMEVTTETGTSNVTKTIEVFEQPGLSGPTRQSGRRVAP